MTSTTRTFTAVSDTVTWVSDDDGLLEVHVQTTREQNRVLQQFKQMLPSDDVRPTLATVKVEADHEGNGKMVGTDGFRLYIYHDPMGLPPGMFMFDKPARLTQEVVIFYPFTDGIYPDYEAVIPNTKGMLEATKLAKEHRAPVLARMVVNPKLLIEALKMYQQNTHVEVVFTLSPHQSGDHTQEPVVFYSEEDGIATEVILMPMTGLRLAGWSNAID